MEKNNKKSDYDFLTESIVNISKAGAYDVVSKQVGELKEVIRQLIDKGDLNDLVFTDQESTDEFKEVLNKAKILSL